MVEVTPTAWTVLAADRTRTMMNDSPKSVEILRPKSAHQPPPVEKYLLI
jgi:hypothetical protein